MSNKFTQTQIKQMRQMRREGKALKEIAQSFNCSVGYACQKTKRLRIVKQREAEKDSQDAAPLFKLILDSDLADKTKVELLKRLS